MLSTLLIGASLVLAQEGAPAATPADLQAVLSSAMAAESYRFEVTQTREGGPGGGGRWGGPGAAGGAGPQPVVGEFVHGAPLHLSSGPAELWRAGDLMLHQDAAGVWAPFSPPRGGFGGRGDRGPGRGERGGRGPGAGGGPGAGAGAGPEAGRGEGGPPIEMLLADLARVPTPAEVLGVLSSRLADAKSVGAGSWTAALSAEALEDLSPGGRASGRGGPGAGGRGGPDLERSGEVTVQAAADGTLQSISLTTHVSGSMFGESFAATHTSQYRFEAFGAVTLDVPGAVTAALSF